MSAVEGVRAQLAQRAVRKRAGHDCERPTGVELGHYVTR
jgi:hypothetical protein